MLTLRTGQQQLPKLRQRTSEVASAALALGALQPLATTRHTVVDGGLPFTIYDLDMAALAAKKSNGAPFGSQRRQPGWDPFAPENRDEALVVRPVFSRHTCVLNKFNVLPDHVLIVTNDYEAQTAPLTADDLHALYVGVCAMPGIGFYNSGPLSGASQHHRHLQLLPYDVLAEARSAAPAAELPLSTHVRTAAAAAAAAAGAGADSAVACGEAPLSLPVLPFRHSVRLMPRTGGAAPGAVLVSLYRSLLSDIGYRFGAGAEAADGGSGARQAAQSQEGIGCTAAVAAAGAAAAAAAAALPPPAVAYNLLLTREWMLAVARSRVDDPASRVEVNAMGFFGLMLTVGAAQARAVGERGPMAVLRGVCAPPAASL